MSAKIKSFLRTEKQAQESSHGGEGPVDLYEIWDKSDFASRIDFIDRVVVPPGSTVGTHTHGNNEEMYVVLAGRGTMTIEGETVPVEMGDMILNPAHGTHGLVNDSDSDIDLLVVQIGLAG
ncbi:MAG: cupin domain-containing protein [Pseudomonadota bacterium]